MSETSGSLRTDDGLTLHTQAWLAEGTAQASVLIVHGYAEHIGRYGHVAAALNAAGYAVYGLDHRGHGRSEGERVYIESVERLSRDLGRYAEQVQAEAPERRLFVLAHSLGTLIALDWLLGTPGPVAGAIFSGTALDGDKTQPGFVLGIVKVLSKVLPHVRLVPPIASTQLSTDESVVQAYDNDPLVDRGAWRMQSGYAGIAALAKLRGKLSGLTMPVLILHGEDDVITPPSGATYLYEKSGAADKTLKTFPGMRHEILNEREKQVVLAEIQQWLSQH